MITMVCPASNNGARRPSRNSGEAHGAISVQPSSRPDPRNIAPCAQRHPTSPTSLHLTYLNRRAMPLNILIRDEQSADAAEIAAITAAAFARLEISSHTEH